MADTVIGTRWMRLKSGFITLVHHLYYPYQPVMTAQQQITFYRLT
jgi:hypothetical protein